MCMCMCIKRSIFIVLNATIKNNDCNICNYFIDITTFIMIFMTLQICTYIDIQCGYYFYTK